MPHRNRPSFISAPCGDAVSSVLTLPCPRCLARSQPQLQPILEVTAQRLQPQPVVPEPLPLPPVFPLLPQLSQSKQKQHFLLFSLVTPPTLPLL